MDRVLKKFKLNLPWLVRYPFERLTSHLQQNFFEKKHIIFTIADHFEPSWRQSGHHDLDTQLRRLDHWHKLARATGDAVRDADGTKFRHTFFFPGEQYDARLCEKLAEFQAEGLGETEVHLHHGLDAPDTADNLRRQLVTFRDLLAHEHRLLSRFPGEELARYAFVHGNLALANSCGGKYCGVDNEMEILAETGCYADMSLPSAPVETQVPIINRIYECGHPLNEAVPHRSGTPLSVGMKSPQLPVIFTGPLVFNWTRRIRGIPFPRLDDGALVHNQPMDVARFNRWVNANITIDGRSDWIFVKLYCHGFFDHDETAVIGDEARIFFTNILNHAEKSGAYKIYFASAREAMNMVWAAIDGKSGSPGNFRDYRLRLIADERA